MKRRNEDREEGWMKAPITFPPITTEDLSDEPLIMEGDIAGYLVRRIYVDEGSSVDVMYEHCFNNLSADIKERLRETSTSLVGFSGETNKPLGKIELEGIATLIARPSMVSECRRLEEKQTVEKPKVEVPQEAEITGEDDVIGTEEVLINPAYPEQLVVIGKGRRNLIEMLRKNKDVFAWEPTDMTGVPRSLIRHHLNVNISDTPVAQKKRNFSAEKNQIITKEVEEWMKAGIVRPVRYPTWISNPVLVKKNAVKGQVLADFISEVSLGTKSPNGGQPKKEICDISSPEEWILYTDGASSKKGAGAGLVLIGPSQTEHTYALRLNFKSTNNEAEYEALLAGLRIARKMNVEALDVRVDSKLVASQINGEFTASKESMIRAQNQKADVLSKLASVAFNHLTKEILVEVLKKPSTEEGGVNAIVEEEGDNWMTPIIRCLKEGVWPGDPNEARALRMKIPHYTLEGDVLFKRSYMNPMARCVDRCKQTTLSERYTKVLAECTPDQERW
ncbi:ribonuclease H-like domain-containing protein [Artemisia annua]|uniref:Ribonuclease H-like domain-containing protein n=1 Tax=Artemisia annua TaxID=35608 RepID=A0A2U1P951_ARTAN|nr:ribonuclease H-like domain-containing protein [Artemisia annua]